MEHEVYEEAEKRSNKSVKWRDESHHDGLLEVEGNSVRWHHTDEYWQRVAETRTKSRMARLLASCMAMAVVSPFCE
jgi:hypothetical protein